MAVLSFDEILSSIRNGTIRPGAVIERTFDDDDEELAWEFDSRAVVSFAVGGDDPGTYMSEPYWGMYLRLVDGDLLFAEMSTEGDGSDVTRFIGLLRSVAQLPDMVADFIMSDNFEMQFAVLTHFDSTKFESWDYPPAEALDEFAWSRTTLSKDDLAKVEQRLKRESPVFVALCEYFESPNDSRWQPFRDDFIHHNNLSKFYDEFKR